MGFHVVYEKEGKGVDESFGSYYLAVCRKEKLRKEGVKSEIKETLNFKIYNNTASGLLSKAERQTAKEVYKKKNIDL